MHLARLAVLGFASLVFAGCSARSASDVDANESNLDLSLFNASKWFRWLEGTHPDWAIASSPSDADPSPWPNGFAPATAKVFAHNEIFIEGVSPTQVYDLMVKPQGYRAFYPNSGTASTSTLSSVGQEYGWATFGVAQRNTVTELARDARESRISWLAASTGTQALHRWIFRAEGGGTRVVTEECQTGWVAALPDFLSKMRTSLPAAHELWLNGLRCELSASARGEAMCTETILDGLEVAPSADP